MVRFPNTMIELWEYHEIHDHEAVYQDPIVEYRLLNTVPADFQPVKTDESVREQGTLLTGQYNIIVDYDVPVTNTMIIREVGKTDTYKIIGEIEINNHIRRLRHKHFKVQHERKDRKLG